MRNGIAEAERLGIASSYGCYLAHTGVQSSTTWADGTRRWSSRARRSRSSTSNPTSTVTAWPASCRSWSPRVTRLRSNGSTSSAGCSRGRPPEGQFSVPYHGARAEHLLWNGRPEDALATSLRGLEGADPTTMS